MKLSVDDPRLRNGDKTMSFALSTYLNSGFDYVFFSSVVVVDKTIREAILKDITAKDYSVIGITLTCSEETLRERHKKRGDANECSFFWLHLKPYEGDYVINTDNKSVQQIVDEMKVIIDSEGVQTATSKSLAPADFSLMDSQIYLFCSLHFYYLSTDAARRIYEVCRQWHLFGIASTAAGDFQNRGNHQGGNGCN